MLSNLKKYQFCLVFGSQKLEHPAQKKVKEETFAPYHVTVQAAQ